MGTPLRDAAKTALRTFNAAKPAIGLFGPGLGEESVDVAADAIGTAADTAAPYVSQFAYGGEQAAPPPAIEANQAPGVPSRADLISRPAPETPTPSIDKPAPPGSAIERMGVAPGGSHGYGPTMEELTGLPDSIRRNAYDPSSLPDWTGHTDASGARTVDMGNLSQAQIGQDINARGMLGLRDAQDSAAIKARYPDPQDDELRSLQRTAQMESLMPDEERPLQGKGGAFQMGPGGAYTGGGAVSRTRGVEPQLRQYGGQRAIDRDMQRQGIADQIQQYGDVERGAAADLAKLRATPEYQHAQQPARDQAEADTLREWAARKAALDKAHGKVTVNVKDAGGFGYGG